MRKQIKQHEERNVKGAADEKEPANPVPAYLLDRANPTSAKALRYVRLWRRWMDQMETDGVCLARKSRTSAPRRRLGSRCRSPRSRASARRSCSRCTLALRNSSGVIVDGSQCQNRQEDRQEVVEACCHKGWFASSKPLAAWAGLMLTL